MGIFAYPLVLLEQGTFTQLKGSRETWFIASDQPTGDKIFERYALHFDIEENFLDDKSNGFQLEASQIRDANVLTRLCRS